MRPSPFAIGREYSERIIVIRVADPDGSLFQTIVDALKDKRAEIIHVTAPFSAVLRIGELEIYHE